MNQHLLRALSNAAQKTKKDFEDDAFWNKLGKELVDNVDTNNWAREELKAQQTITKNVKDDRLIKMLMTRIPPDSIQDDLVTKITDEDFLLEIALGKNSSDFAQQYATDKLTKLDDLLKVIHMDTKKGGSKVALLKVQDMIPELKLDELVGIVVDKDLIEHCLSNNACGPLPDKLKHSAIKNIDDEKALYSIVMWVPEEGQATPSIEIRSEAFDRLKDPANIKKALLDLPYEMTGGRIPDALANDHDAILEIVTKAKSLKVREEVIELLEPKKDEALLKKIAQEGSSDTIRQKAIDMIEDEKFLMQLYFNEPISDTRKTIVNNINNEEFLKEVLKVDDGNHGIVNTALKNITDLDILKEYALRGTAFPEALVNIPENIRDAYDLQKAAHLRVEPIKKFSEEDIDFLLRHNTSPTLITEMIDNHLIKGDEKLLQIIRSKDSGPPAKVAALRALSDPASIKEFVNDKDLGEVAVSRLAQIGPEVFATDDSLKHAFMRWYNKNGYGRKVRLGRVADKTFAKIVYRAAAEDDFETLKLLNSGLLEKFNIKLPSFEKELASKNKDIGEKVPQHKQQLLRLLLTLAKPA